MLTVTGPRQAGKTTVCRAAFPTKRFVSLEPPDEREFARTDPRGFLHQLQDENWVVSEIVKSQIHRGFLSVMHFFRDAKGHEVDLILDLGHERVAIEIKAGQTIVPSTFDALRLFAEDTIADQRPLTSLVIYGGDTGQTRSAGRVVAWRDIGGWWNPEPGSGGVRRATNQRVLHAAGALPARWAW